MPQRRQHTRIVLLAIALLLCPVLVVAGEGSKVPDETAAQVRQAIESHVKKDVALKNSFLLKESPKTRPTATSSSRPRPGPGVDTMVNTPRFTKIARAEMPYTPVISANWMRFRALC